MDKVNIIGGYGFVDFSICTKLLEKGYEVNGILIDDPINENIDEKRMLIGRNANFKEYKFHEWDGLQRENQSRTTILSLYDFFMDNNESSLMKNKDSLELCYQLIEKSNLIVLLLPTQILLDKIEFYQEEQMKEFVEGIEGINARNQFFYLPAIYGPWQPATFLFQQSMISSLGIKVPLMQSREWRGDALYINDALDPIIEIIESEKAGHYLLESGIANRWNECAEFLKIDPSGFRKIEMNDLTMGSHINRILIKTISPISDSFKKQRENLENLYNT